MDLLGRKITFQAKEFPHLAKLESFNSKQNAWSDALAKFAIPALKAGTLDSSRYRIGDASRPRTLFWVPDILQSPDSIHPNKRNPKNSVYAKRYKRDGTGSSLKIVLVQVDDRGTLCTDVILEQ